MRIPTPDMGSRYDVKEGMRENAQWTKHACEILRKRGVRAFKAYEILSEWDDDSTKHADERIFNIGERGIEIVLSDSRVVRCETDGKTITILEPGINNNRPLTWVEYAEGQGALSMTPIVKAMQQIRRLSEHLSEEGRSLQGIPFVITQGPGNLIHETRENALQLLRRALSTEQETRPKESTKIR